ncbi:unnamed protein product, partial [Ectocarpus sp. 12 AP-2014]
AVRDLRNRTRSLQGKKNQNKHMTTTSSGVSTRLSSSNLFVLCTLECSADTLCSCISTATLQYPVLGTTFKTWTMEFRWRRKADLHKKHVRSMKLCETNQGQDHRLIFAIETA